MPDKKPKSTPPTAESVALGGAATKPSDFRAIGAPTAPASAPIPAPAASTPQPKVRAIHSTFDTDPVAENHRSTINSARNQISSLVTNIDRTADSLRRQLETLDTPEGKAECKRQDFSPEIALKVIDDLDAIIEQYKPRES